MLASVRHPCPSIQSLVTKLGWKRLGLDVCGGAARLSARHFWADRVSRALFEKSYISSIHLKVWGGGMMVVDTGKGF